MGEASRDSHSLTHVLAKQVGVSNVSRITKQKAFVLEKWSGQDALDGFSHLAYAGVRESVRTQDLSHEGHNAFMTCRDLGTSEYRYLNACDCIYWHCILQLGGE